MPGDRNHGMYFQLKVILFRYVGGSIFISATVKVISIVETFLIHAIEFLIVTEIQCNFYAGIVNFMLTVYVLIYSTRPILSTALSLFTSLPSSILCYLLSKWKTFA